jgi:hypothetical protein
MLEISNEVQIKMGIKGEYISGLEADENQYTRSVA